MIHPAPPADPAIAAALETMRRGAAFVGAGLFGADSGPLAGSAVGPSAQSPAESLAQRCRARLAGNGLRELDRFLNLLLDAAAGAAGDEMRPAQANTAVKYRDALPAGRSVADDHRRLLALGRSRACLFYCEGVVRRPDRRGGTSMTIGWPDAAGDLPQMPLGAALRPDATDFADVARFYGRLADRIAGGLG